MTYKIAYAKVNNSGDLFNEAIMDYFGKSYKKTDIIDANLVMLGGQLSTLPLSQNPRFRFKQRIRSIMCNTDKPLHVWGTGYLVRSVSGKYLRQNLQVHALRGELTRKKLKDDLGYEGLPILADPGLLAAEFVKEPMEKQYQIGFIPHFRELDLPIVQEILEKNPEVHMIDITKPYMQVFHEIKKSEMVISSSLHGLIFSDSLKVPNKHIILSERIKGDGFKFRDYYSSYGLEDDSYTVSHGIIPKGYEVVDSYKIDGRMVEDKIQGLITTFPAEL